MFILYLVKHVLTYKYDNDTNTCMYKSMIIKPNYNIIMIKQIYPVNIL